MNMKERKNVAPVALTSDGNEGEGNVEAARRYSQGLRRSIASGSTLALARKARDALNGPEAPDLAAAERAGKLGESALPTKR